MIRDMERMHNKFDVYEAVDDMDDETLRNFLKFRISCIQEELSETAEAVANHDAEETVDGLIDILVFTIGTLDLFEVDIAKAWKKVFDANMTKEIGIKTGRPNPYGLPDLTKPEGWEAPSHAHNHGILGEMFNGNK